MKRAIVLCAGACAFVTLAASSASAQRERVENTFWFGTVTEEYSGTGSVDNGNCPGCTATSSDHATVVTTVNGAGTKITGIVSLKETNMYNSQCSGTATRTELDHGTVHETHQSAAFEISATRTGSTPSTTRWTYGAIVNGPGIPYKGAITEEQTSVVNGQRVCTTAARPSSGSFYIPGVNSSTELIAGSTTKSPSLLSHLSGHRTTRVDSCGYPRTACTVTMRWSFRRATKSTGEKPGK